MFAYVLVGLLFILTILLLRFFYEQNKINSRLKGFTTPPGLPLLKHFFLFTSKLDLLPNLLDVSNKFGGLVKLELCSGFPFLLVTDTKLISYILSSQTHIEKDAFYKLADKLVGNGLITCSPSKWKITRKIINPAFNVQVLENHVKSFRNPSNILLKKLRTEIGRGSFDVIPYISLCVLDIICEATMNIKLNSQENTDSQYLKDIREETEIIIRRLFTPLKRIEILYMFSRDYWKERKIAKRLRDFTNDVINIGKKAKAMATSNGIDDNHTPNKRFSGAKQATSLLDILLDATYIDRPMTNTEIMDEVQSFVFAGHETISDGVSFVLYCLSKHPDVQDRVVEEINDVFGNDTRSPNAKDLNDLVYLDMVIKETMRIYPPVPFLSRLADEDISYGDILIPKGMPLMIFIYGIHRNPNYFPNPNVFDPSRFESEIEHFTFIPFSAGPRNCIGYRFALMEMKYLACEVVRNFKILPVPDHIPKVVTKIALKFENGVMIKLESR